MAEITVRNALQALKTALDYFQERSSPQAPSPTTAWTEKTVYAEGIEDYAVTGKHFTSGDWKAEVTQDVAPLSRTLYLVTVFSSSSGWYWQGQIKADGGIIEVVPLKFISGKEKEEVEAEFIRQGRIPPPRPGSYGH